MIYTAIETFAIAPFFATLMPVDLQYIVQIHRQLARNDRFSRLQGGAQLSTEYLYPNQVDAFQRMKISYGASQYRLMQPGSTDDACLAYGSVYCACIMALRHIYIDSYTDADTALAQLDALGVAGNG